LHWQIGRLLALEDAVDISGRAPVLVDLIWRIGNQAAGGDKVMVWSRLLAAVAEDTDDTYNEGKELALARSSVSRITNYAVCIVSTGHIRSKVWMPECQAML
jgi:hypothetical protein